MLMVAATTLLGGKKLVRKAALIPRRSASPAVISTRAAAPSFRPEALAAVTEPVLLKAGLSPAMAS